MPKFKNRWKILYGFNSTNKRYREKAPSNKIPALRKSKNMVVWAGGTLNQLFVRGL